MQSRKTKYIDISNEKREDLIRLVESSTLTVKTASECLNINYNSARHIIRNYNLHGIKTKKDRGGLKPKKLNDEETKFIRNEMEENYTTTLKSLQERIIQRFQKKVSLSTLSSYVSAFRRSIIEKTQPSLSYIQIIIKKLMAMKSNKICFDCGVGDPKFASVTYGAFLCLECAKIHKRLNITEIRCITSNDRWTWKELVAMQVGGNEQAVLFFQQHNIFPTSEVKDKYQSETAQLYKTKIDKLAREAMENQELMSDPKAPANVLHGTEVPSILCKQLGEGFCKLENTETVFATQFSLITETDSDSKNIFTDENVVFEEHFDALAPNLSDHSRGDGSQRLYVTTINKHGVEISCRPITQRLGIKRASNTIS